MDVIYKENNLLSRFLEQALTYIVRTVEVKRQNNVNTIQLAGIFWGNCTGMD